MRTSKHKLEEGYYSNAGIIKLDQPSFYTPDFIVAAFNVLEKIYKKGFQYKKAAVVLMNIVQQGDEQMSFDFDLNKCVKHTNLITMVDKINNTWGSTYIKFGAGGFSPKWKPLQQRRSPRYTTNWNELPIVRAN